MKRPQIHDDILEGVYDMIIQKTNERLEEKGRGIFVSSHEMLGVITEEFFEFKDAVEYKEKDADGFNIKKGMLRDELIDIAVSCVVSLASLDTDGLDWL